ncbi:MAG: glycosyltransferase family 2 protein [Candidatus Rokuibacteriota bacterium]
MLSVVVCTFNRASKLRRCLRALAESTDDRTTRRELIVVDNNSSDTTRLVVDDFAHSTAFTVKYVREDRQGLSHARNTGVRHAAFPFIAFTDDDCVPDPEWMTSIADEFMADRSLALLGGRVEPLDSSDDGLGVRRCAERTRIDSYGLLNECMIGCNFAVRRTTFDLVGPFDVRLGRGTPIDSGEDRDFFYRILKRGLRIEYSPRTLVYHGHGRQSRAEIQASRDAYATGRGAFYCKHIMAGDRVVLRRAVAELTRLAAASLGVGDNKLSNPMRLFRRLVRGAVCRVAGRATVMRGTHSTGGESACAPDPERRYSS